MKPDRDPHPMLVAFCALGVTGLIGIALVALIVAVCAVMMGQIHG